MAGPPFIRCKPLWQISLAASPGAEEIVGELLEDIFAEPPSIYTTADTGRSTVTVYCQKPKEWLNQLIPRLLGEIADLGADVERDSLKIERVKKKDWAESWKKYFKTIEIGSRLIIKPSWSKRKPRRGQAVVVLDPGLSFGTGQHPTTHFCLKQLALFRRKNISQSLLDIGTGSGILAISAAKLGYAPVEAFDLDPVAVRIAQRNARRNRVTEKIKIEEKSLAKLPARGPRKFDLVCANLMAELLIAQRKRIMNCLRPDGLLVLAGILASQFAEVEAAYRSLGMELLATDTGGEWQSGAFTKVPPRTTG